jgi:signal transduction histidine kinase
MGISSADEQFFSVLLVRTLIAASVLPLSDVLWRHRPTRYAPVSRSTPTPARSAIQPRTSLMRSMEAAALARREAQPSVATAVHVARPRLQTLERPRTTDLYGAIRMGVAEAEDQGLRIRLMAQGSAPVLPPSHVQLVARAVEVTLDNVRCHAHTLEAEVCVTCAEEGVQLTIRDRGEGLLDGTAEPPGFHQLRRLRYCLEEIEGSLLVHEDAAGGVLVTVRVPCVGPDEHL